ncbi:MAG: hypothetical protein KAI47_01515 [Deltaproteobacteria bacterium]|nr:hypothetical protein [Deltaproteobacteria bacterium]
MALFSRERFTQYALIGSILLFTLEACSSHEKTRHDGGHDFGLWDHSTVEIRHDLSCDVPSDGMSKEAQISDASSIDAIKWPQKGMVKRQIRLPACQGAGPGTEDCHAHLFIEASLCRPSSPCDKLVVYWAGGDQSCSKGVYDPLMKKYAEAGYVAACAQTFTTSAEAGRYPYYREFARMDVMMRYLRALPEVVAVWNGKKLLISGVSHGATAPLAAIAAHRALKDHAAIWTGQNATAVVLYDGISNTATLEEWTASQPFCSTLHQRFVGRYGDGSPLVHTCSSGACFCANPPHRHDWEADTLVLGATYPKSPYQCQDFTPVSGGKKVLYRFVSCSGKGALPCGTLGDIIPDAQQKLAYDALATCSDVIASYERYPLCSHAICGSKTCGLTESLTWLDAQGF